MGANQTTLSSASTNTTNYNTSNNSYSTYATTATNSNSGKPNSDTLPLTFEHHPVLKHYYVEQLLVPGSGRMMNTYRILHKKHHVAAVCKAMYIHEKDIGLIQEQMKELQKIKYALSQPPPAHATTSTNDYSHTIATFDYFTASIPIPIPPIIPTLQNQQQQQTRTPPSTIDANDKTNNGPPSTNADTPSTTTAAAAKTTTTTTNSSGTTTASLTTNATTTRTAAQKQQQKQYQQFHMQQQQQANQYHYMENKYLCIYLIRSHVYTTLSDRLASRPFLTNVEKLFITFQILDIVQYMHTQNVIHGFLTTENIGLTSYNQVILLDIASYKSHTTLPDDDPSEYLYYFATNSNRGTHTQTNTTTVTSGGTILTPTTSAATTTNLQLSSSSSNSLVPASSSSSNTTGTTANPTTTPSTSAGTTGGTGSVAAGPTTTIPGTTTTTTTNSTTAAAAATAPIATSRLIPTSTATNREKRCYLAPERFVCGKKKKEVDHQKSTNAADTTKATAVTTTKSETVSTNENDKDKNNDKEEHDDDSIEQGLTYAMDIFSIGCVLIETFLNGERALDLGDLMEYRSVNTNHHHHPESCIVTASIQQKLNKIESSTIRATCKNMIHIHPQQRLTPNKYLEILNESNTIPLSLFHKLNGILQRATHGTKTTATILSSDTTTTTTKEDHPRQDPTTTTSTIMTPDARIAVAAIYYGTVLYDTIGIHDVKGIAYFQKLLGPTLVDLEFPTTSTTDNRPNTKDPHEKQQQTLPMPEREQMEEEIDLLFAETEALLSQLDTSNFQEEDDTNNNNNQGREDYTSWGGGDNNYFLPTSEEEKEEEKKEATTTELPKEERSALCKSSLLIYFQLILSNIRHAQRPTSKLIGLKLIQYLCIYTSDETKLQRIVPTCVSLLNDTDALVRAFSIKVLTKTLSLVNTFPPSDSKIFPQYIFKKVSHLLTDPSLIVRLHFTSCIVTLAETSLRFLDITHTVQLYEAALESNTTNNNTSSSSTAAIASKSNPNSSENAAFATATGGGAGNVKTSSRGGKDVFTDDVAKLLDKDFSSKSSKDQEHLTATATSSAGVAAATVAASKTQSSGRSVPASASSSSKNKTLINNSSYETELMALQETISRWVIHITTDQSEHYSSPIKRALLRDLDRLCIFFGLKGVMEYILPLILAFLNDRKDYQLRMALFTHLPSVCNIIGRAATEHFVLPCLESGLIDNQSEQVISCAVLCLKQLIQYGLIVSRSLLIGDTVSFMYTNPTTNDDNYNTAETNQNSGHASSTNIAGTTTTPNPSSRALFDDSSTSQEGLLKKFSALLVHPSAEIRHNAVLTMNAACLALGSPDSEIYIAYLLRPFLRFQPSEHHLRTPEGMKKCLYPPWNRARFENELNEFLVQQPGSHDNVGPWTSVGPGGDSPGNYFKSTTSIGEPSRSNSRQEGSASIFKNDNSLKGVEIPLQQVQRVREYLRMFGRNRAQQTLTKDIEEANLRKLLFNGIEGSLKLAQKLKVPRQDTIGSLPRPVPNWYSNLREKLRAENKYPGINGVTASESSAIQSISALGQVYGLSIMDGSAEEEASAVVAETGSTAAKTIASITEHSGGEEEINLTDEDIQKIVQSDESKASQAVCSGEWGSETQLDHALLDTALMVTKLKALKVPPLPPNLGELNPIASPQTRSPLPTPPSIVRPPGKGATATGSSDWKPKVDTLVATSSPATGHTAPVVRLAVSLDQSFFVSASYDGTCRVWEMPQLEKSVGVLESTTTYSHSSNGPNNFTGNHNPSSRINDLAMVEGSHSVVSGASDGTVHVWRVDLVPSTKQSALTTAAESRRPRVVGTSAVRKLDPSEGEVLSVSHFNLSAASIATYATQKGSLHSWDLRCCEEPFVLKHGPDIGYLTSMALGSDRNWLITGTSRGYLTLWDLRFHQAVKLWRHSRKAPVTRLATSFVPPPQVWGRQRTYSPVSDAARPFVFAACGPNECAMFDVTDGSCRECFRTMPNNYGDGLPFPSAGTTGSSGVYDEDIPILEEVPISFSFYDRNSLMTKKNGGFGGNNNGNNNASSPLVSSINAMVGSIGATDQSYLITGGGDCRIRFWDFSVPSKCHIVSGQTLTQPRPSFERVDFDGVSPCRLMLCRQSKSPNLGGNGGLFPSQKLANGLNTGINRHHSDAVQDLKIVNNALISCSRDCTIKIWR